MFFKAAWQKLIPALQFDRLICQKTQNHRLKWAEKGEYNSPIQQHTCFPCCDGGFKFSTRKQALTLRCNSCGIMVWFLYTLWGNYPYEGFALRFQPIWGLDFINVLLLICEGQHITYCWRCHNCLYFPITLSHYSVIDRSLWQVPSLLWCSYGGANIKKQLV